MSKPFIPWQGGKRRLANTIIPMFPKHTCYVEPFAGAAALYFMKEPSKVEILNDINSDLVNLYRVLQHHLEEFLKQFKWALTSRQIFEWEKLKDPSTLTDIQRAARFYYIQKLCFGARPINPTFGIDTMSKPRLNILRMEEELSEAHLRLSQVCIEYLPWEECIKKYDRPYTLFYIDPPYYKTAGYGFPFDIAEYRRLTDTAKNMQGKCIISINDHPKMREIFTGMKSKKVKIDYTVAGSGTKSKSATELIYKNW